MVAIFFGEGRLASEPLFELLLGDSSLPRFIECFMISVMDGPKGAGS